MRLNPFKTKAAIGQPSLTGGGWRRIVHESFPGAWQKNIDVAQEELVSSSPTLYACLDRISSDLGKLPWRVKKADSNGIPRVIKNPAIGKTLRSPNSYQNWSQFVQAWSLSKLMHGNALILKNGGELYVLDWTCVTPLVSEGGSVFYQVHMQSEKNLLPERYGREPVTIPAADVIHDRATCLFHQLIGIPPVTAAFWPTAKAFYIDKNAAKSYSKGDELSGVLSIPAGVSQEDATTLQTQWNQLDFNSVRVIGADAKFTPVSSKASDSQTVEQLQLSAKEICTCFGIPAFIVGAAELPSGQKPAEYMNSYFKLGLQQHVHAIENLLTDGLDLPKGQFVELGTEVLLRLDEGKRAEIYGALVASGITTVNEARREFNLPPLDGGDTAYLQQQYVPLDVAATGGEQ